MYRRYFGFAEKPFDLTPDPRFIFLNRLNHEIITSIINGIEERRGIILLIGEAGTGKTIMLNAIMERLPQTTKAAFIFNTKLTFKQMLLMTLVDLGIIQKHKNMSRLEASLHLSDFALSQSEAGGNVVLIVDEAQNLQQNSLENLRLLSNLEAPKHKLVQVVLCGQPVLDAKLSHPKLNHLAQRISLRQFSKRFNEKETYEYIRHWLDKVNYKGNQLFDTESLKSIWEYSQGIPLKINILCDHALLIGYALEKKQIDQVIVKEAVRILKYNHSEESVDCGLKFFWEKAALFNKI